MRFRRPVISVVAPEPLYLFNPSSQSLLMEDYLRTPGRGAPVGMGTPNLELIGTLILVKEARKTCIWSVGIGGSISSSPAVHNGVIYFGAHDKNFYALDAETGKESWRFQTSDIIVSKPFVRNGIIYFGSHDNNIYALNLDGKPVWKREVGGPVGYGFALKDNAMFFGCFDQCLYALSLKGKLLWKYQTGGPISSRPILHKDSVYFGSWDFGFYSLSPEGKLKWRFTTGDIITGLPCASENRVFIGSFDNKMYALSSDGKLLWRVSAGDGVRDCIVDRGIVYFTSRDNKLYAVSEDGKVLWKYAAGDYLSKAPAISGERIYFGSSDSNLYCLTREGKLLWKFQTNGPVVTQPILYDNRIYFGSIDTNFYALNAETGKELWRFPTSLNYISPVDTDSLIKAKDRTLSWKPKEGKAKFSRNAIIREDYAGKLTKYGRGMEFGSDFESRPYKSREKYGD